MKKIILIMICLISINVYAESFYTDYHLVKENEKIYFEDYSTNELKKLESKVVYNNYKEVISEEGYYELNSAPLNLIYSNLNDYITKDVYQNKFFNVNDDDYTTLKINNYSSVRFIQLRSFTGKGIIKSINIFYNNKEIKYSILETNYDFISNLQSSNKIVLDLNDMYELKNLKIIFNYERTNNNKNRFMLDIYSGSYIYYYANPKDYYQIDILSTKDITSHQVDFTNSEDFLILLSKMTWVKQSSYNTLMEMSYFKKSINLYKYYSLKKEYLNEYTSYPLDGYLLDFNNSINLYNYYERDYIEISDNLEDLDDLSSFIISTSIPLDHINLEIKSLEEELLLIIKTSTNTFYKKYPNPKNDNKEIDIEENNISEEINDNKEIDNIDSKDSTELEDNKNIQVKDNKDEVNKNQNETVENIIEEEIIIEKDFGPNYKYEDTFENISKPKEENNNLIKKDIKEVKKETKKTSNKTTKHNNLLIIIILICVKLFTLYKNKKSSFVESV